MVGPESGYPKAGYLITTNEEQAVIERGDTTSVPHSKGEVETDSICDNEERRSKFLGWTKRETGISDTREETTSASGLASGEALVVAPLIIWGRPGDTDHRHPLSSHWNGQGQGTIQENGTGSLGSIAMYMHSESAGGYLSLISNLYRWKACA